MIIQEPLTNIRHNKIDKLNNISRFFFNTTEQASVGIFKIHVQNIVNIFFLENTEYIFYLLFN